MDNFTNSRHIQDITSVNRFMSRMYGLMGLAVLVSALTAYLTSINMASILPALGRNQWLVWLLLLLPFGLIIGISFNANRSPVASFVMLMVTAVVYGFMFALIALAYTTATLTTAFVSSAAVFVSMALIGSFTKRDLSNLGSYAFAALIGLIVALVINMFLRNPAVEYIFSFIGVIIFTILSATDANKMKRLYLTYGERVSANSLALVGAVQLYLDFINLFMFFLEIFGGGGNRN